MRPIRVVFDGHHLGRQQTGNETYAREMARSLADRDDLDVIVTVDRGRRGEARDLSRATIVELPRNPLARLAALPIVARQRHAHLIHTMYYRAIGPARPTVVSVHDVSYERFPQFFGRRERAKNRLLIGDAVRRAAAVCTLTNHAKSEIVDVYGVDPRRIFVVPCGVAPSFLDAGSTPHPPPGERLDLLAVGSLQPRKNIRRLVAAVRSLAARRPVKLSLIGPEGYQAREIRESIGRDAVVEFLGYVSEARLIEAYRRADIFVYPSVYEGFGLPVIEAMACGTPVVTSTGGSIPEVAGAAALLVDPDDTGSIEGAIERLADDESLRLGLAEAGLARARAFTWPAAAQALVDAYRAVLAT